MRLKKAISLILLLMLIVNMQFTAFATAQDAIQENTGESNNSSTNGSENIGKSKILIINHILVDIEGKELAKETKNVEGLEVGKTVYGSDYLIDLTDLDFIKFKESIPQELVLSDAQENVINLYYELNEISSEDLSIVQEESKEVYDLNSPDIVTEYNTYDSFNEVREKTMLTLSSTSSQEPQYPNQGAVRAVKQASWVNQVTGEAKVVFEVDGVPVKNGVDVVLVLDRSGSMNEIVSEHVCGTPLVYGEAYGQKYFGSILLSEKKDAICSTCNTKYTAKWTSSTGWGNLLPTCTQKSTKDRLDVLKESAKSFVDNMFAPYSDGTVSANRVGLVSFNSTAVKAVPICGVNDKVDGVNSKSVLVSKIDALVHDGGTNFTNALAAAQEIINERSDKTKPAYIVFMTDGEPDPNNSSTDGISTANTLKSNGVTIYSIGLVLTDSNNIDRLKTIASSSANDQTVKLYYDVKDGNTLTTVFNNIANNMKIAGTDAMITDLINTVHFDLDTTKNIVASRGTTQTSADKKTITWNLGNITSQKETLTLYVKLKSQYLNIPGSYYTNESAKIKYTNYLDVPNIEKPITADPLPVQSGQITIIKYLVNDAGKPINNEGTIINDFSQIIKLNTGLYSFNGSTNLALGQSYTVTADNEILVNGKSYQYVSLSSENGGTISPKDEAVSYSDPSKTVYFGYKEVKNIYNITFDNGTQGNITAPAGMTVNSDGDLIYNLTEGSTHPSGPIVTANRGYEFDGWYEGTTKITAFPATVLGSHIYVAKYKENESDWATVEFQAGLHGSLAGKTSYKVIKGTAWDDIAVPTIVAVKGYQSATPAWDNEFPTSVEGNMVFVAQYVENESDWATVEFQAGLHGSLTGTTSYRVIKGTPWSSIAVPTIVATKGYQSATPAWDKTFPETVDSNLVFVAQYVENESDWATVEFQAGLHGSLTGTTSYRVIKGTPWSSIVVPTIVAVKGYQSATPAWDNDFPTTVEGNMVFVAQYVENESDWATVEFQAGAHGSLTGKTSYKVIKGTAWTDITVPTIVAVKGYQSATPAWDNEFPTSVEGNMVFVAQYVENELDWATVEFQAGLHGSLTGKTSYRVIKGTAWDDIVVPTIVAVKGYQSATPAWDKTFPETVDSNLVFVAQYVENESDWATVEFQAGLHGSLTGTTSYRVIKGTPWSSIAVPTIVATKGYQSATPAWNNDFPTTVDSNLVFVAQYVENESDWATVEFQAGLHGSLTGKTSYKVIKGTAWDDIVVPTIVAVKGYQSATPAWDNEFPTTVETNLVFIAQYVENESDWATVEFQAGLHGSLTGTTSYRVIKGTPWSSIAVPTIVATKGYQSATPAWDNEFPTSVDSNLVFVAQYVENESDWATVEFQAGTHGSLTGKTSYKVIKGTAWDDIAVPTIVATKGYQSATPAWDNEFPTSVEGNLVFVAQYVENESDWATIEFQAGLHGSLTGTTSYRVIKGTAWDDIVVPTIVAVKGYQSATPAWDKTFPTSVEGNMVFVAQYVENESDWATVEFHAGAHGSLTGTTSYRVIKGTPWSSIAVPTIVATKGYQSATPAWDNEFPTSVEGNLVFVAQYVEKESDWATVEFQAGLHGSLTGKTSYRVIKGTPWSSIAVPTIVAVKGYQSATPAWDKTFPETVDSNLVFVAQYVENESDWATVEFQAGLHGSLTGKTSYRVIKGTPWSSIAVPTIVAVKGYQSATPAWDNEFPTSVEGNLVFVAQYVENELDWATVEFQAGLHGSLTGKTSYKVIKGTAWDDITVPTIVATKGYQSATPAWDNEFPTSVEGNLVFVAQYVENESDWATVEFQAGLHGNLTGKTSYRVIKGTAWHDIVVPTIVAVKGYQSATPAWDKTFPETVEGNLVYVAEYLPTIIGYTVNYLEQGTNKILANPKHNVTAKMDEVITEIAIAINNYTAKNPSTVSLKIGSDKELNIINFYYSLNVIPPTPDPTPTPKTTSVALNRQDHYAYVIGYPEGDIRPENTITREEVATIFYRLLTDESRTKSLRNTNTFNDIQSTRWSNTPISTLYGIGIINGYEDGTFKPEQAITRGEFAAIASRFDKLEASNQDLFTDIKGHWASKYINSSALKGWIKGYPDKTFKPDNKITRAEAMTLINAVLDRIVEKENIHKDAKQWPDIKSSDWFYDEVLEATNSHDYIRENLKEIWIKIKANKIWP